MTVPVPGSLVYTYSADDSTTSFSYPVRFLDKAEIVVILREGVTDTAQVLGTDYTISGSSWPSGGSIVFGAAPASGKTVVIYRSTVPKQLVDLENTQRNDANAVETQLDRLAMVQQDHGRKLEGTWQTRPGETAGTIQSVDDGHILVSDGDGNLVDGGAKSDLATAEQGELADTAVQPGDAEALPTDGADGQILVRDTSASAGRKWSSIAAGTGDMLSSAYDPAGKGDQVLTVTDAPSDPDLSNDTDKLALRGDVLANVTAKSVAEASTLAPVSAPDFIQTAGYASAGDGGGALYKKVAVEPSHEGKFSITLDDGVTVVWFEIAETTIPVKALGAKGDTVDVAVTASITSGTKSLTAAGASFTADDVGKLISIPGAGAAGAFLGSTISAVTDSTHVTLADNAGTTLSAVSETITYGTDDTDALTAALAVAAGRSAFFAHGVYSITTAVLVHSGTTIRGVYGASIIKPATKYTGVEMFDGACFRNLSFGDAVTIEEIDLLFVDMAFDYTSRTLSSGVGQKVGIFLRYVERPKVLRCMQWSGGDLSGMLACKDTQVSDCVAYDIRNCAYDHWSSTGYVIVSNCVTRSDTVSPGQCIQVTADDTDPVAGTTTGTGHVEKIVVVGNIVDVPGGSAHAGIIVNCLNGGASAEDVVVGNNYVRGCDYGIAFQGNVNGFVVSGNMLRDITTQGILFTKSATGTATQPSNGVVSGNLIADCGAIGIDVTYGDDILIFGNKVSNPTTRPVRLQAGSSNCIVKDNMCDDGSGGGILDGGTGNIVIEIGTTPAKAATNTVFSGSAAPTSFTDLDLSSVVGAKKAFCMARVLNQSGGAASYIFRTNGDTLVEAAPATAGNGPNICNMQNNEANYVTFITDGAGIVEWCSTVGAGTTTINLLSYQPLQ